MTPDGARPAAALRLLGVALVALLVTGCGVDARREVARLEQELRALPGVESAEGGGDATDADVRVTLTDRAEPAHVARVVREAVQRLTSATAPEAATSVRVVHADRPPIGVPGEFTASTRSVAAGDVAAESMAADARIWCELADAFPGAYATVRQEHFSRSHYLREVVVSLTPGAAVAETFHVVAGRPFAPADTESVTVQVPALREVPGHRYVPWSGYTLRNTRAESALRAFEALIAAQPAGPGAAAGVRATASEDGPGGPRLDVDVDLVLAEFADLPADVVAMRIPGSAAESVAAAYPQVLDASGLPYELAVAVADHPPFLEVGG